MWLVSFVAGRAAQLPVEDVLRAFVLALAVLTVSGCATLPGANYPKQPSTALANPESTKLGRQLETHFGMPLDVEWAFEHGRLYLLQSRLVTA